MSRSRLLLGLLAAVGLVACAAAPQHGTLAELETVAADTEEIYVADSLERAAQSYRRYLEETPKSARTPEAMRRLADLQIEQAYGVLGSGEIVEMAVPDAATPTAKITADSAAVRAPSGPDESEAEFEQRATQRQQMLASTVPDDPMLVGGAAVAASAGPLEAIKTYWQILEEYPNYERNDQVLYQLSRAYDEVGEPDKAMEVMERLIADYPYSYYLDEVYFRRGEYFFVRKRFLDAEESYGEIIEMGATSSYYELALYKQGWSFYKQELYEEALHRYMGVLDHRLAIGFDFDAQYDEEDEHRLADTFRVVSLSFSNLGGPGYVDEYFSQHGHRVYADKIYSNLGEFYFEKLRFEDAASVYKSFVRLNPFHRESPNFGMRVVEIYTEAGFPQLVVEAKKDFASRYALDAEYWNYFSASESAEVIGNLKTNLNDLAGHYHALYQEAAFVGDRPENFKEAQRWYRQFLVSFPTDAESPGINYQLADLFFENGNFGDAAREYEQTAYNYDQHEKASAAGYAAVYAHRQDLELATGARKLELKRRTVDSSLRFADTFPDHEQAPIVLGSAADELYEMKDLPLAIEAALKLIERYPETDRALVRQAWAVVANSSIDLAEFQDAEHAYANVLALTDEDDEKRTAVIDGLAASIYKQGEQANLLGDYAAAAAHFLRIKERAPTSAIRSSAEYDAASALMKLEDWTNASSVLEEFRASHPEHELGAEATKQLAFIYQEDGQTERSALEHERVAKEADDPELAREALLTAGELYDEANVLLDAVRVYESYVEQYPRPLDFAVETRNRLAEIFKTDGNYPRYYEELHAIIALDDEAGAERTDRSRYLAAKAALEIAELTWERFASIELVLPFEESLASKQQRMDESLAAFEALVDYEVADVTAAATYYIAEIYFNFSQALLNSERPDDLTAAEKVDYEMVIEEEAYPFEERAIEVHEMNFQLLAGGVFNTWVQNSLDKLAVLMPGRYAKNEISDGLVRAIDTYAYRTPAAPAAGPPAVTAAVSE